MNKYIAVAVLLVSSSLQKINAQYYHKDIISVYQANAENRLYAAQQVKEVIVHSFEPDGIESKDFVCRKKVSKNFRTVETITSSPGTASSVLISEFNEKNQLVRSSDSSEITAATSLYEYDQLGRIIRITAYNHSSDDDFTTSLKEVHEYTYNSKDQPLKMLRIKNDRDTLLVEFLTDSNGNVSDEIERTPGGRHCYYYYNENKQLTDIVRYNVMSKSMKPDFVFAYNEKGQVTQMVTVEEGVTNPYYNEKEMANYFTWRYYYNDEGLRIIEKCFSRGTKLIGYVEYEYE
jgi:YD repeat-containing protein